MFLHGLTYRLALPLSLQQALADDDGVINNETSDMNLDGDDWITASEDDGECDEIINDLRGERREAPIWFAFFFLIKTHLTRSPGMMGGLEHSVNDARYSTGRQSLLPALPLTLHINTIWHPLGMNRDLGLPQSMVNCHRYSPSMPSTCRVRLFCCYSPNLTR